MVREQNWCVELREQFRLKHFGLSHGEPHHFVKPQCFRSSVYVLWSGFWFTFFFSMLLLDVYYNKDVGAEWLVFLTNWTYLIQSLTLTLDFTITLYVHCQRKDIVSGHCTVTPWYMQSLWVLCNITNTMSILVTLLYYILLGPEWSHGSVNKHLLNSVYTLLALLFNAKPIRLLHFYQPLIYSIVYIIFSVIYHVTGGGAIYEPLDWSKTGPTVGMVIALGLVGIPAVHLFCFALHTFRIFVSSKHCAKISDEKPPRGKSSIEREITPRDVRLEDVT